MSVQQIRAFIAIKLPQNVRDYLGQIGAEMQGNMPHSAVRWVKPDSIHLTIRFLGDTPVDKLPRIAASMDQVVKERYAFEIKTEKLGCFPNPRRPRVIWIGLSDETEQLLDLQRAIEEILLPLGWQAEKRHFHPHLTLGRIKDSRAVIQARLPWGTTVDAIDCPVTAVHLIESQLKPSGAVYSTRHTSLLAARAAD